MEVAWFNLPGLYMEKGIMKIYSTFQEKDFKEYSMKTSVHCETKNDGHQ